jgi:hypothetical protein
LMSRTYLSLNPAFSRTSSSSNLNLNGCDDVSGTSPALPNDARTVIDVVVCSEA